jgi:hypothetical protein
MGDNVFVHDLEDLYWCVNANGTVYAFSFGDDGKIGMNRIGHLYGVLKYSKTHRLHGTNVKQATFFVFVVCPPSQRPPDNSAGPGTNTTTFALAEAKYVDTSDKVKFPGMAKCFPHCQVWIQRAYQVALSKGKLAMTGKWLKEYFTTNESSLKQREAATQDDDGDEDNDEAGEAAEDAELEALVPSSSAFDISPVKAVAGKKVASTSMVTQSGTLVSGTNAAGVADNVARLNKSSESMCLLCRGCCAWSMMNCVCVGSLSSMNSINMADSDEETGASDGSVGAMVASSSMMEAQHTNKPKKRAITTGMLAYSVYLMLHIYKSVSITHFVLHKYTGIAIFHTTLDKKI